MSRDELFYCYHSPKYYVPKDAVYALSFMFFALSREASEWELLNYNLKYIGMWNKLQFFDEAMGG